MAIRLSDLTYAARVLRKSPAFSLVAVAALALGIGANTAIFSVVSAVLLEPLPYPEPDRLVRAYRSYPAARGSSVSIPKFLAWSRTQSLEAIAAYDFAGAGLNLESGDRPEQVRGIHTTRDYFRVLRAGVALGRTFTAEEDQPSGPRVVVVTHGLWSARFARDPDVVGRPIRLNGELFTIVGVLDEDFHVSPPVDLFMALQADPNTTNQGHFLQVIGRLKPHVPLDAARAEFRLLADDFRRQYPHWMSRDESASVDPMQDADTRLARPALLVLLGAVGLVLLIACANVASLLLVRAAGRRKEIAIRVAIGASRRDVISQLLAESLLLALMGAAAGLGVGIWGAQGLLALAPEGFPRAEVLLGTPWLERVFDWRVLTFTLAVAVTTGILFGLAPALHLARSNIGVALKAAGAHGATMSGGARLRGALVVAEVALALVLLAGATLLIRTFATLQGVEPGFDPQNTLTLQTSLAGKAFATPAAIERLIDDVTGRLAALPEVKASALTGSLPMEGFAELTFVIDGRPLPPSSSFHGSEDYRPVSRGYFDVLRIPLLRGRLFDERDNSSGTRVMIVNAAMAKRYWPGADAIGQRVTIGGGLGPEFQDRSRQIVGIVADVRERGLRMEAPPVVYIPATQVPEATLRFANALQPWSWTIRTRSAPGPAAAAIQHVFIEAGALPTTRVRTMEQVVAKSIGAQGFNMLLLTVFGALAVGLAAMGIYGLMSYNVQQGTRDIGVRLALGAASRDIVSMVVGQGMRLAAAGMVIGLVAASGATRVLRRLLFGVEPTDPLTFVSVTLGLGAIALLACYLPARRAARVDPLAALRSE